MWFLNRTSFRLKSESIVCAFAHNVRINPLQIIAQNSWQKNDPSIKFNTKHGCICKIHIRWKRIKGRVDVPASTPTRSLVSREPYCEIMWICDPVNYVDLWQLWLLQDKFMANFYLPPTQIACLLSKAAAVSPVTLDFKKIAIALDYRPFVCKNVHST
jgi:hypothetical protein